MKLKLPLSKQIVTCVGIALLAGCASTNPYEAVVVEGIDTAVVPADERPRQDELRNQRATIVVLPALDSTNEAPAGFPEELGRKVSATISKRSNARITSGDKTVRTLIDQQKRSASSIYDPAGAIEVGKLLSARYVAALTIDSMTGGSEYDSFSVEAEDGSVYVVEWWDSYVTVGMSLSIIDAETGEYVFQKHATETYSEELDNEAGVTFYNAAMRKAAEENLDQLTLGLGALFPISGYVLQSRGERDWLLINLSEKDGISKDMGFFVYRIRTTIDPITGKEQRQHIRVGEIVADQPDQLGFWCKTVDGAENVKVGMLVKSSGRYRTAGLFGSSMIGE